MHFNPYLIRISFLIKKKKNKQTKERIYFILCTENIIIIIRQKKKITLFLSYKTMIITSLNTSNIVENTNYKNAPLLVSIPGEVHPMLEAQKHSQIGYEHL